MVTRFLIVDDDEEDRELFCEAVKEVDASIKCCEAVDGEAGMRLLTQATVRPDFVFLDINMPRMNGFQFIDKIKAIPALADIPVIIYSTSKLPNVKIQLLQKGAVHFITKPDKLSDLMEQLVFVLWRKWELPLNTRK